jgi:hypothetical protein
MVNSLYPESGPDANLAAGDPLLSLWLKRREVNDRELARLERTWKGPRIDLPLLPLDRGPDLVAELDERIETGLAVPS